MVEVLGIIIDIHPKGRPRKRESQTIEKIGYIYLFSIRRKKWDYQQHL